MDEDAKRTYYVCDADYPDWKFVTDRINPRIGELILSRTVRLTRATCGDADKDDELYVPCQLLYPR
ncbi:unnamed protein product [marine sediment metagenome]|uniref:Uncharacterized protein n=1 Tax=marine sediment metagenome TaxID=412755 RepID=X1KYG7_9ZZZZ